MSNVSLKSRIVVAGSLALGMLVLPVGGYAADPAPETTPDVAAAAEPLTVEGVLEVDQESFLGEVQSLRIVTSDQSFRIADDDMGEELKQYVGESLQITAQRELDDEGEEILVVKSYQVPRS